MKSNHNSTRSSARSERLEALNAALGAAEEHLYALNLGVEGDVEIWKRENQGLAVLGWTKRARQWGLMIGVGEVGDADPELQWTPILEAPIELRIDAAPKLPELLAELQNKSKLKLEQMDQAIQAARAFAQGSIS